MFVANWHFKEDNGYSAPNENCFFDNNGNHYGNSGSGLLDAFLFNLFSQMRLLHSKNHYTYI